MLQSIKHAITEIDIRRRDNERKVGYLVKERYCSISS